MSNFDSSPTRPPRPRRAIWPRRIAGIVITLAIFVWILRPIARHWRQVREPIEHTSVARVLLASVLFSIFLFVFRAMSWRRILIGFGHRLPVAPATRIWSSSELSRYLPGVVWQMLSRIYLVRPYGVRAAVCSASQILELALFLLANILLAMGCLVWLGVKTFHGVARHWLFGAAALVPVLLLVLHPGIFYRAADRITQRLGRQPIEKHLRFSELLGLLVWAVLGLLWQSMALWLIVSGPLHLQFTKWWVVAGAYSLAWCAGFLAFWAPGGIGVRELVFVTAMDIALPARVRVNFADPKVLLGFLAFLSVLLRLWATCGELILAGLAYSFDYRGALGRPDAPGRVREDRLSDSGGVIDEPSSDGESPEPRATPAEEVPSR